jgi:hypothetical protein
MITSTITQKGYDVVLPDGDSLQRRWMIWYRCRCERTGRDCDDGG